MRFLASAPWVAVVLAIAGCGTRPLAKSEGHVGVEPAVRPAVTTAAIPEVVRNVPMPPAPQAREPEIRYSVVVANQPVREVLLAMARETKINFDIDPRVEGIVNINAIDQTLKQILTRMAKQVDMRWEYDGQTISVMPDTPYLRTYHVDYVNMTREVTETVGISTQVISGGVQGASGAGVGANANNSTLSLNAVARNRFWETLEKNVKDLLRETDKLLPEGSSETFVQGRSQSNAATTQQRTLLPRNSTRTVTTPGGTSTTVTSPGDNAANQNSEFTESKLTFREAASVVVNPETGVVMVRATSRQHEKVAEFLSRLAASAKRQVLIEATVVEVTLNDNYQAGVDWSALGLNGLGYSFTQAFTPPSLSSTPNTLGTSAFTIGYSNPRAAVGGSISSSVKLLDTFGKTRVLSTPMLMVMNNQTATLKVVDNRVYFTVKADTTALNSTSAAQTTFTTTQNVVPIGFIMNVTAQISEGDRVTLSLRPTVTRIIDQVADPNPQLAQAKVTNLIPVTQTREMESVLRLQSGQTAILGGLMMDSFEGKTTGLPVASRIPVVGDFFAQRNDQAIKSELVIFVRPTVIHDASMDTDLAQYRRLMPGEDFFHDTRTYFPCIDQSLENLEERARNSGAPCNISSPVATDPPKASP